MADFAWTATRSLTADKKYDLLTSCFKPTASYSFPKTAGRSFQYQWLTQFPWLVYSRKENGGFCLPCLIFASGYRGTDPGVLVSRPLIAFAKALELLRKHADKHYHKDAVIMSEEFLKVMSNQQPDIQVQLNQALADRIALNRQKLTSIFKTIVLCGRQSIALRGHRDNATDIERDLMGMGNHGNFLALLDFRIDAGDTILGDHISSGARNAKYTSSIIQNQIIDILADQVRQTIVDNVKRAKWYSVIADEVTDVSNKEQLSLSVRYVDVDKLEVREDLLGFFECDSGITGLALAEQITSTLQGFGLDLSNLRGQAYDGAGNMAGSVNGAAARISANYPLATYTHCASHCLNLAVVSSLNVTSVQNMMGVVGKVYVFFNAHPKRQRAFESAVSETQPDAKVHKLKDLCRTRWVQRIDAIDVFCSLHRSIVGCMESICDSGSNSWSSESLTDARSLLLAISTTDFLAALVITNFCLKYLQALTSNLQGEAKDIVVAVSEINTVISTLQDVRENIETYHSTWFTTVQKMCEDVGTDPSIPRRCGRQLYRSNHPATTPSEYYRRSLSIPLIDHFLFEMQTRFSPHQKTALLGLSIVPSLLVTLTTEDCQAKVGELAQMYEGDLPSSECVSSEIHCWEMKWKSQLSEHGLSSLPSCPASALRQASSMFPNIRAMASILCTLPVTSCTAERSFSSLKRNKTPFRSSMTTQRLTGLTLLAVHRDTPLNIEEAIDEFSRRHPLRLRMVNVLED